MDVSNLALLIRSFSSLFCNHEWVRRHESRRVYLECVHCLATTRGLDLGPELTRPARSRSKRRFVRTAAA
jgi:hypothetical protein